MKKYRFISVFLAIALLFGAVSTLSSCDSSGHHPSDSTDTDALSFEEQTDRLEESETEPISYPVTLPSDFWVSSDKFSDSQLQFSLELFKKVTAQRKDDSSALISPLSVALALTMAANGADGDTRAELESLLGLPIEELNEALRGFMESLPQNDLSSLHFANSVWFREGDITLNEGFVDINRQYFDADVLQRPFDRSTVEEINDWVNQNTNGMIERLLEDIDPQTMVYLINALVLDAKWADPYRDPQVQKDIFTAIDGSVQKVDMLCSEENLLLNDGKALGFIKRYQSNYSFVALLPNRELSLYDYIAGLDAESLRLLLSNPMKAFVSAKLPRFSYEYSTDLSNTLKGMGLKHTFAGQNADFSKMGICKTGPLAVSEVVHKSVIELTQYGTRAAAVSAIVEAGESMEPIDKVIYPVHLDRPFLYMIVENETLLPIFMGTVTDFAETSVEGSVTEIEPLIAECSETRWIEEAELLFADYLINKEDVKAGACPMLKVDSEEELASLARLIYPNGTGKLFNIPDGYFEKNTLILTYVVEGSGSIRHEIGACTLKTAEDYKKLSLSVTTLIPFVGTCDMKAWFMVIGAERALIGDCDDYQTEFKNVALGEEVPQLPPAHKTSIRVDWCGEAEDLAPVIENPGYHTPIIKVDSKEKLGELTALLEESNQFDLSDSDGDLTYRQLTELLDEDFFAEYGMILAYVSVGSGSIRFRVGDCPYSRKDGISTLTLSITKTIPTECTEDMAGWFICVAVNKSYLTDDLRYEVKYDTEPLIKKE